MSGVENKSFATPDETRTPAKTRVDVVRVGGTEVGRFTFEPGGSGRSASNQSSGPNGARTTTSAIWRRAGWRWCTRTAPRWRSAPERRTGSRRATTRGSSATRRPLPTSSRAPIPTPRADQPTRRLGPRKADEEGPGEAIPGLSQPLEVNEGRPSDSPMHLVKRRQ